MHLLSGEQARAYCGSVWAHRATAELVSSARFERLATGLARAGAPAELTQRARDGAADERRHAALCVAAAERFGAVVAKAAPPPLWRPLATADDVLREAVAFCALSESLNATLMAVSLQRTTDDGLRTLLRALLTDEVQHARLGWAVLSWQATCRPCAFLDDWLLPTLQDAVADELLVAANGANAGAYAGADTPSEAAAALGMLSARERLELIAATLRDVVFPGLSHAGIDCDAASRWVATLG